MPKNVIVIKKPGELIHVNYLGRVVKEYPTYMGTALVHEGKLIIDHRIGQPTVEAINELQNELKALEIVFCFGENRTLLAEDMMPYQIVLDKDKNIIAALCLEGNFQGFAVAKSSHVNEFHCKESFLVQKLPKIYRSANAGMAGFITELKDPVTQQDLSNCWTDRGFMTLLTTEGPAVSLFNKGNVFRADYNWGMTSQSLNYVEKTEAKRDDAPKQMSVLERLQAKIAGKPVEEAPAAKAPAELPKAPPTETSTVVHNNAIPDDLEWVGPAPKNLTNTQKSSWWHAEVGYQPEAYKKENCRVQRKKGTKVGVLAPLVAGTGPQPEVQRQQTIEDAATHVDQQRVVASNPKRADPQPLPDKTAPEGVKDTSTKHVSVDNMPIMSPKQKLLLKQNWLKDAEVLKTLGDDFKILAFDPKRLKEFEESYQTFWDGLGMEPRWLSFEAITKLGIDDFKALCQLMFNTQNDHFKTTVRLNSILSNPANKITGPQQRVVA